MSQKSRRQGSQKRLLHGSKHKFDQFRQVESGPVKATAVWARPLFLITQGCCRVLPKNTGRQVSKTQIVDQGIESDVIATGMRHATIEQIKSAHPDLWNRFENDLYQYAMQVERQRVVE